MGDITNTTLTKVNNMIKMNFKNYDNGQTRYVICDKRDSRCFDWSMNDKGFVWVSTIIL